MNIYDTLFTASDMFSEQVARQVFDGIGEDGPFVTIIDETGVCRSSDENRFGEVFDDTELLNNLLSRIGDGDSPVTTCINGCGVIAGQLRVDMRHLGYVIIGLNGYNIDSTVANYDLGEMLLNQINTIASLQDNFNQLHHRQLNQLSQSISSESLCVN